MEYKKIIVEREGGVVVIKLNNPERMNAGDPEMNRELHEELMPVTMELAHRIAKNPPIAIGLTKYVMYKALQMSIEDSMSLQNAAHTASTLTEDHKEGVRAYVEKREPKFQGR